MKRHYSLYDLPECILHSIYKRYYTENVLIELCNNKRFRTGSLCLNCCVHGFPCFLCAEYTYLGTLGPGYEYNKRKLEKHNSYSIEVLINIISWIIQHKELCIIFDNSIFSTTLPQNIVYRDSFTQFFHESIDYYMNRSIINVDSSI